MPPQNTPAPNSPPFEVITSKKSSKIGKKGLVYGIVAVVFLALSIVAGVLLVKNQQNISEKASTASVCPGAEACPVAGQSSLLRSCNSVGTGGTPREISCSTLSMVGTISICGAYSYCCPSLGASWTTDLTLCSSPTPTSTVKATATATASATPTKTATSSATPKVQTTPLPVPETGTNWPTLLGGGIGILVIIGAILLAL